MEEFPILLVQAHNKTCPLGSVGLLWRLRWQNICLQCRRPGFDPWVKKIPQRRAQIPTPVFLPGESYGQGNLTGYSPWGHKSRTRLSNYSTTGSVHSQVRFISLTLLSSFLFNSQFIQMRRQRKMKAAFFPLFYQCVCVCVCVCVYVVVDISYNTRGSGIALINSLACNNHKQ